jgi:hypothetical protein
LIFFRCCNIDGKSPTTQATTAEQDIFGSLLDKKHRYVFEEPVKTFYFGTENIVVKCLGVHVIHAAGGYLIAVCLQERIWSILVYKLQDFDTKTRTSTSGVSSVFSISINAGHDCDKYVTRPVVTLVKPFDQSRNVMSDCVQLNKILYNQLFGFDNNLMDVPVILLGLPNGHVYSVPMNGTSVALLYQCHQPVVGIHGMVPEESDSRMRDLFELSFGRKEPLLNTGSTTLAVTCSDGNVGLIHGSSSSKDPVYLSQYLQGPLVSAAAYVGCLVLASWRDLYKVEMKLSKDDDGQFTVESEKTRLGYGHITDVLFHG